jgi:hypothetical protein
LQWAHCCNDLCIIDCNANHFTLLMPHAVVGGALDVAVVPAMSEWMVCVCEATLDRRMDLQPQTLLIDDEQPQPQPPEPVEVEILDNRLHAAPAAAGEVIEPLLPPPPVEEPPPQAQPYVLPHRPRSAAEWQRSVWARDENLPAWTDGVVDIEDYHGTLLPDLDATAGRHALGLNDLAWTASDAPAVVFMLHDFLSGVESWSELAFATQLPVFGLHTPPGLLSQFFEAVELSDDAADCCSVERIAAQYLESVHACLAPCGADCIIASFIDAAPLATELASQLRSRYATRTAVSVLFREHCSSLVEHPLAGVAYQALHSLSCSSAASTPPPWHEFAAALGADCLFDEHLSSVAELRPPGVSTHAWETRVDHAVRGVAALFEVAKARLPCTIEAGHVVWLSDEDITLLEHYVLLPRRASFARVLRFGRESASRRQEEHRVADVMGEDAADEDTRGGAEGEATDAGADQAAFTT